MNQFEVILQPLQSTNLSKKELIHQSLIQAEQLLAEMPTLELATQVAQLETVLNVLKEKVLSTLKTEYAGQNGSYGAISLKETKGRRIYDYSNDSTWCKLKTALDAYEAYLKTLPKMQEVYDNETGELIAQYPPRITYAKDSFSISLH